MKAQGITSGYAFSRNPIILSENFPTSAFDKNGGRFTITMGGTDIYDGRFFPPLHVDISEIVDASVDFFPEPDVDNSMPVIEIEDAGSLANRVVYAYFEYDSYDAEFEFIAIPGGVSRQNFKRLNTLGKDIFNTRFLNFKSNLFLTTRTAEWRLIIKESELYPLYFIVDKPISTFKIVESVAGTSLSFNHIGKGVYALDIETLRYRFFSENHVIANVFDLFIDSEHSCRIIIEQSDLSKERYRLKFRNSLGVFEILELTGSLSINPDYSGSEDSVFQRYDSLTGSFYSERERIARSQCISVETGVKRPDEVRFLMDAIGSEEVYLLDVASFPIKVIPSIEEFAYIPRPQSPERFTLKLKIAESETNIMQDVIDGAESEKPQIFSNHFTNQFN